MQNKLLFTTLFIFMIILFTSRNDFLGKKQMSNNNSIKQISLPFIKNVGQSDSTVKFYANTFSGSVFINKTGEIYYSLPKKNNCEQNQKQTESKKISSGICIKEKFIGKEINTVSGYNLAACNISSFTGSNSDKWFTNINAYESISLGEVYKGINIKLKAYANNIEKLFFIDPGHSPQKIKIKIEGAKNLIINKLGELIAETELGSVIFTKPIAYQENEKIEVAYTVNNGEYGFNVGHYDKTKELVIDPLLASTFLGGSSADDTYEPSIALNKNGNVYVSGYTSSSNFPITTGIYDESFNGGSKDRFISKFNNNLSTLLASTFIGGSGDEQGMGLSVDDSGYVYIAGYTSSSNFPTTPSSYDQSHNGGTDVFVSKFDSNLTTLVSSTFIGGSGNEGQTWPRIDLTISPSSHILVAGLTRSANFPVSDNAFDRTYNGGSYGGDPFIAKFDQNLTTLMSSTFLGGNNDEWRVSVLTDNSENIYICGETESSNFPTTAGAYDQGFNGWSDVFISKLNSNLSALNSSTFLGKSNTEEALAMRLNNNGDVYITGYTKSTNFPTTTEAYDRTFSGGDRDAYIARFSNNLSSLLACTFIGGSGRDDCRDIFITPNNNIYVTGNTTSSNFYTSSTAYDISYNGGSPYGDAFIAKIDPELTSVSHSTFFGANSDDCGFGMAIDKNNSVFITGITSSTNLPVTSGSYDESYNGQKDCFIAKFDSSLSENTTPAVEPENPIPSEFKLLQNYPNPFNPITTIAYTIPETTQLRIEIYNMSGQIIKTLFTGVQTPGEFSIEWDGTDSSGNKLASGIYIYALTTNKFKKSNKMMLLK